MKRLPRAEEKPSAPASSPSWQSQPWQARLALGFARDGDTTRLVERRHEGPLRVQKPLYPESPAVCHAIVVHPPGGIVGGDQLEIGVRLEAGAAAFITSPGAAKWYRANGRQSCQRLRLKVGAGAALEWLPQETILYDAAEVQIDSEIELEEDASYLGCDILCFGRSASGERFESGRLRQATRIRRQGRLIWFEQGSLLAGADAMRSPLGLGGNTVCATFLAAGRGISPATLAALREEQQALGAQFGVTQLKHMVVARYLGHSSEQARQAMLGVWRHLRPAMLGRTAITPRIWNT